MADSGIRESLGALLLAGVDVSARDNMGRTPLFETSNGGKVAHSSVRLFLEQDADATTREKNSGRVPLHCAAQAGYSDTIQLLINHGAEINDQDLNGDTALHLACRHGRESVAQSIIENGANISFTNISMQLPLQKAAGSGNIKIIDSCFKKELMQMDQTF